LDFKDLKTSLKVQVSPVYLVYGMDLFLLYKSAELISAAFSGDAETTKFDGDTPPETVVSACRTPSFFGGKRIVIYKIAEKTAPQELNAYIKDPNPDAVLVIWAESEKNGYNIKGAAEINCNPMPAEVVMQQIVNHIAPKRITRAGAEFLCGAAGNNYTLINNELTKIVNYFTDTELLDTPHIKEFVIKTVDYQIYELGAAILQNKLAEAGSIMGYLLSSGTAEYAVFGGVVGQFRRAFYSAATKCDANEVAKVVGCSPGAVFYSRRDFGGRAAAVAAKYRHALELEYKIKSGQIGIENAVFALLFSCK
jgi:DNA polymerase III delta subunit